MRKTYLSSLLMGASMLLICSFQAQALMLAPGDADTTTRINRNLGTLSAINSGFGASYADMTLLWKGETGGAAGQDGTLAGSYEWHVNRDASGGTIDYVSGEVAAACPTCFLIVKGGSSKYSELARSQYLFDLGDWDGMEQIVLSDFWPLRGAISNVAIWGGEATVSEPSPFVLMSIGFLSLLFSRKRKLA